MRLLLILALLAAPLASADELNDRLERLEKTGRALARRAKYAEAIEAFRQILRLSQYPSGATLYNLGQLAEEGTKDFAGALLYYEGYLVVEPDGVEAADVKRRVERLHDRLAASLGRVAIRAKAEGLPVRLNDVPIGSTPVNDLQLPAGSYTAKVEPDDYFPASETFAVEPGVEARVQLQLKRRVFKGTLTVVVDPPDATIRVDERVVAEQGPYTQRDMPTRTVLVRIDKPGWDRWVRYVTIERDSEVRVDAKLEQTGTDVPIPPLPLNDD